MNINCSASFLNLLACKIFSVFILEKRGIEKEALRLFLPIFLIYELIFHLTTASIYSLKVFKKNKEKKRRTNLGVEPLQL